MDNKKGVNYTFNPSRELTETILFFFNFFWEVSALGNIENKTRDFKFAELGAPVCVDY